MGRLKNLKREKFCQLYSSNKELFGNGVASYVKTYNIDLKRKGAYAAARASASYLLTNPNILKRIDELMDIYINDQVVDKELAFVIMQKAELSAKVAAIREYNQLKSRIRSKLDIGLDDEISEIEFRLIRNKDEIDKPSN